MLLACFLWFFDFDHVAVKGVLSHDIVCQFLLHIVSTFFSFSRLFLLFFLEGDLVHGLVKEVVLHSNHQVQHEERAKDHREDTKDVHGHVTTMSIAHFVHDITPAFQGNHLELGQHRDKDVVPVDQTNIRVAAHEALVSTWTLELRLVRLLAEQVLPVQILQVDFFISVFGAC